MILNLKDKHIVGIATLITSLSIYLKYLVACHAGNRYGFLVNYVIVEASLFGLLKAIICFTLCVLLLFYLRNPLSIETKLCMLTGYTPAHLKKLEWSFNPKVVGTQQTRLLVAFAGGGVRVGAYTLAEFEKASSKISDCDVLLLSDPLQLWYLSNYDELHAKLKHITKGYKTVMLLGNCLGGSGALLYADLASTVLTFGPQTSLVRAKGAYWLNSFRLNNRYRLNFENLIESKVSKCKGNCFSYFSAVKDTYMAAFVSPNIISHVFRECNVEVVPQWLKKNKVTVSLARSNDSTPFIKSYSIDADAVIEPGDDHLIHFIEHHFIIGCNP